MNAEKEFNATVMRNKYETITDKNAYRMIQHVGESHQLLHHCSIWGLPTGIHIVGDKTSNIIQATVVNFNEDLLDAYLDVIDDIKDEFLSWAYDDDVEIPQDVMKIAESIGM